jgi:hypothetical protein
MGNEMSLFTKIQNDGDQNSWIQGVAVHEPEEDVKLILVREASLYAWDDDAGTRFVNLTYLGTSLDDVPTRVAVGITEEIFAALEEKFREGKAPRLQESDEELLVDHAPGASD